MLSEVSVFIAAGQRKMNTFVTRNTKVGNSVPVAKKDRSHDAEVRLLTHLLRTGTAL